MDCQENLDETVRGKMGMTTVVPHVAHDAQPVKMDRLCQVVSLWLVVACVGVTPFQPAQAAEKLVMVTPLPNTEPLGKWVELIFTEAFRRLNLELEYKVYPAARAGTMANAGEVDGELGRPIGFEVSYPNLVRVEEPSIVTSYMAYAIDPTIQLTGWDSLKDAAYRVDYLRGAAVSEQNLSKLVPPDRLEAVNEPVQGLKKLVAKRTDVFVIPENMVAPLLATDPAYASIRKAGVMQDIPMYPYFHKKHADLAPQLAEVLKQMKTEGLIEHYQQEAITFTQQ